MKITIKDLLQNNEFHYQTKDTPLDNYRAFQQALCFVNGVEFLRKYNYDKKPVLILFKAPGLSIDLERSKLILNDFNEKLLVQLNKFINKSGSQFELFQHFYELYRVVYSYQEDYRLSRDQFFATVVVEQIEPGDIRKLGLPYIQTNYKSLFKDAYRGISEPISYSDIGTEGKEHIRKLYVLRRKYNKKLLRELDTVKEKLFKEEKFFTFYKYNGEVADLLEVAYALYLSGNLRDRNNNTVQQAQFAKDLASFLGRQFSTVDAYNPTIENRIHQEKSFLHASIRNLKVRKNSRRV